MPEDRETTHAERSTPRDGELADEVYQALRGIARAALARLPGRLDPTDLVHQAWVGLSDRWRRLQRSEFLALCATVMRHIAVDEARRAGLRRQGADTITLAGIPSDDGGEPAVDLLDLDAALERLKVVDERWARIVELRYFGGLTGDEVGEALGLSRKTVGRDWVLARAWLKRALSR